VFYFGRNRLVGESADPAELTCQRTERVINQTAYDRSRLSDLAHTNRDLGRMQLFDRSVLSAGVRE
jgi:hypothetical protein